MHIYIYIYIHILQGKYLPKYIYSKLPRVISSFSFHRVLFIQNLLTLAEHWFKQWDITWQMRTYYLNQWWQRLFSNSRHYRTVGWLPMIHYTKKSLRPIYTLGPEFRLHNFFSRNVLQTHRKFFIWFLELVIITYINIWYFRYFVPAVTVQCPKTMSNLSNFRSWPISGAGEVRKC